MTHSIRLILKLITLGALGWLGFYQLTCWAAPAYDQQAILVGLLLTSFGAALAKFAMEIVVLPLAVLGMIQRVIQGKKPLVVNETRRDPLESLGRMVFVAVFATLAGLVGVGAGLFAGGLGFFLAGLAFAAFGAVLAALVPAELMWATEGDQGAVGLSDQQRAEVARARSEGDTVVAFTERVAKGVRDKLVDDEGRR